MFPVKEIYLEDILVSMNYKNSEMKKMEKSVSTEEEKANFLSRSEMLKQITQTLSNSDADGAAKAPKIDKNEKKTDELFHDDADVVLEQEQQQEEEEEEEFSSDSRSANQLDEETKAKLDEAIANAFLKGEQEHFDQLVELVLTGDTRMIDYQVSF